MQQYFSVILYLQIVKQKHCTPFGTLLIKTSPKIDELKCFDQILSKLAMTAQENNERSSLFIILLLKILFLLFEQFVKME